MAKTVKEFFDRMIVPQPNSPFGKPAQQQYSSRSTLPGGGGISGTIALRGADELAKALEDIGPALEKKILARAMRDAAKPILEDAKRRAPVLSGQLRKSIKIRSMKRVGKGRVGVIISTEKGFFKGETFYGAFHEFGTKNMPARPFIRPAFEANKARAVKIVGEAIKLGLEDVARGATNASQFRKLAKAQPDLFLPGASDDDYNSGAMFGGAH